MIKNFLWSLVIVIGTLVGASAMAQTAQPLALPPALNAALLSGNASAMRQVITTLSGGNPARSAELAQQLVAAAERLLASNPQAAINAAGAAVDVVAQVQVQTSAPPQVSQTITIASRIFINPTVQRIAPQAVASGSQSVASIASNPAVYAASPQAAISAMANAYAAVNSASVLAAAPGAAAQVTQTLNAASQSSALAAASPTTPAEITEIINRPGGINTQTGQDNTGGNTGNNNNIPPPNFDDGFSRNQASPT